MKKLRWTLVIAMGCMLALGSFAANIPDRKVAPTPGPARYNLTVNCYVYGVLVGASVIVTNIDNTLRWDRHYADAQADSGTVTFSLVGGRSYKVMAYRSLREGEPGADPEGGGMYGYGVLSTYQDLPPLTRPTTVNLNLQPAH